MLVAKGTRWTFTSTDCKRKETFFTSRGQLKSRILQENTRSRDDKIISG